MVVLGYSVPNRSKLLYLEFKFFSEIINLLNYKIDWWNREIKTIHSFVINFLRMVHLEFVKKLESVLDNHFLVNRISY